MFTLRNTPLSKLPTSLGDVRGYWNFPGLFFSKVLPSCSTRLTAIITPRSHDSCFRVYNVFVVSTPGEQRRARRYLIDTHNAEQSTATQINYKNNSHVSDSYYLVIYIYFVILECCSTTFRRHRVITIRQNSTTSPTDLITKLYVLNPAKMKFNFCLGAILINIKWINTRSINAWSWSIF